MTVEHPPLELHASADNGTVDLAWYDEHPDSRSYRVYYQAGETAPGLGEGTQVVVPAGASAVQVTGLTNGTTYSFSVFSFAQDGTQLQSAEASATPTLPGVEDLQAAGSGSGSIVLTWTLPEGVPQAVVRYSPDSYPAGPTDGTGVTVAPGAESVTVTGLTDGTDYYFSVFATSNGGFSEPANISLAPLRLP